MLRCIYAVLRDNKPYQDPETDYEQLLVARNAQRWIQQLQKYGFLKELNLPRARSARIPSRCKAAANRATNRGCPDRATLSTAPQRDGPEPAAAYDNRKSVSPRTRCPLEISQQKARVPGPPRTRLPAPIWTGTSRCLRPSVLAGPLASAEIELRQISHGRPPTRRQYLIRVLEMRERAAAEPGRHRFSSAAIMECRWCTSADGSTGRPDHSTTSCGPVDGSLANSLAMDPAVRNSLAVGGT